MDLALDLLPAARVARSATCRSCWRRPSAVPAEAVARHLCSAASLSPSAASAPQARAPACDRVRTPAQLVAPTELEQVVEPLAGPALCETQQAPALQQGVDRKVGGNLIAEPAGLQRRLGHLDLAHFDQGLNKDSKRVRGPEVDAELQQLERRPGIGLGARQGAPAARTSFRGTRSRTPVRDRRPQGGRRRAPDPGTPRQHRACPWPPGPPGADRRRPAAGRPCCETRDVQFLARPASVPRRAPVRGAPLPRSPTRSPGRAEGQARLHQALAWRRAGRRSAPIASPPAPAARRWPRPAGEQLGLEQECQS